MFLWGGGHWPERLNRLGALLLHKSERWPAELAEPPAPALC